ncbi:MAG TPA: hypothetical protein PKD05_01555 [Candidatus Melainabacteria bacterium]|nr:hypothetical protein [Candidatus Melainabacteria bacterium]
MTTGVAHRGLLHSGKPLKRRFNTPESAGGERRSPQPHNLFRLRHRTVLGIDTRIHIERAENYQRAN